MIGAFNTVYTALKGFLSGEFWASVFAPVAMVAAIHLAIAMLVGLPVGLVELTSDSSVVKTADTSVFVRSMGLVFVGLVLVGYLLQFQLPFFRGLLDGSLLPVALQDRLLAARKPGIVAAQDELDRCLAAQANARRFRDSLHDEAGPLMVAYRAAALGGTATKVVPTQAAETALSSLRATMARNVLPDPDQIAGVRDLVIAALAANDPSLQPGDPGADLSRRTDALGDSLLDRADDAARQAEADYQRRQAQLRTTTALPYPRATSLGDARFVAEHYAEDVYAVSFDYLWPRLVLAVRGDAKDDPCVSMIEQGRARCDFAVLSVFLTLSVPVVWMPYMLLRGGPGWLFLAIGATTPVALHFFYRLAFEAQLAFAEVVKTTIDRHRLRVLTMLRQPMPASRDEERTLWTRLANAEQNSLLAYLPYAPPPGAGK